MFPGERPDLTVAIATDQHERLRVRSFEFCTSVAWQQRSSWMRRKPSSRVRVLSVLSTGARRRYRLP